MLCCHGWSACAHLCSRLCLATRVPEVGLDTWQLGHEGPLLIFLILIIITITVPPPAQGCNPAPSAARCCSFSSGSFFICTARFSSSGARDLNGSGRAHLPAVRDDRARTGLWLDAVPETECQAPQTGWTSAALKHPGMSGSMEGEQPASQDRQRRERPEEEWTHREKSLIKRDDRYKWPFVEG